MAIDPKGPPAVADRVSALENEIPTYRAVSTAAVVSLVLGLVALLSLANLWFLLATAGAVLVGLSALRRIRRYPDLLTGANLARAGIAVGLLFGLAAATSVGVQAVILRREASSFARQFAGVLQEKDFADAAWFMDAPAHRRDKSGQAVLDEYRKGVQDPSQFQTQFGALEALVAKVRGEKLDVEYQGLERCGTYDLTPYMYALYEVHRHDAPGSAEYALVNAEADVKDGQYSWMVKDLTYPYTKGTARERAPVIDDGHGHGPGGH